MTEAVVIADELRVTGTAHVTGAEVTGVVVTLNGRPAGTAVVDPSSEWTAVVPMRRVPSGPLTLGASALVAGGLAEPLEGLAVEDRTVLRSARPRAAPFGAFDNPADGTAVHGRFVDVHGWLLPPEAVDRVEVAVDSGRPEPARIAAQLRPDLVEAYGDAAGVLSGWWHTLDLGSRPEGAPVVVRAEAVCGDVRIPLGERRLVVGSPPPATAPEQRWARSLAARAGVAARAHVPADDGLRLLVVAHSLERGGAQRWLDQVLRHVLSDLDVRCVVLAPSYGPLCVELEALGATVHLTGPMPGTAAAYESAVRRLVPVVADEGCNVAMVNTLGCTLGVDLAARCGIPAVLAVHEDYGVDEFCFVAYGPEVDPYVHARVRGALDDAAAVLFVADATREKVAGGAGDDRFVKVRTGIDLAAVDLARAGLDRRALRSAHGFGPDEEVLLCVASVEPRKSQSMLVLALSRLAREHPAARLALVGAQPTPYAAGVVDLAAALGLGDRVRVVPDTPDLAPWYVMADAFVLASDVESLPLSIVEAMAFDVPVLATAVGGVPTLVEDGVTGILCPTRDLAGLTAGLRRVLAMPADERAAMARAASARVAAMDDQAYSEAVGRLLRALAKDQETNPRHTLAG